MKDEDKWKNLSLDWREFNDESVSFCLSSNIKDHGYGGHLTDSEMKIYTSTASTGDDYSKNAYMLVYEKKLKNDIRMVTKAEEEGQPEVVETENFNQPDKQVPSWITEAVKKDNRAHIAD